MKLFKLAAFMFAVALAVALFVPPDAFATLHLQPFGLAADHNLLSQLFQATPALLAMRSEHAEILTRATAKQAELIDGLAPDAVRAIENAHTELVRQAAAVATRIATEERSIAAVTPAPPVPGPEAGLAAERTRAAEINDIGVRSGIGGDIVTAALRDGMTVEIFRARAFDHMASQSDRTRSTASLRGGQDETQTRMNQFVDALTVRMGGASALRDDNNAVRQLAPEARTYLNHSFADLASVVLNERSMPRDAAAREEVLRRAMHTTSDFPVIFESSINRVLAARYVQQAPTYRQISAQRNFRDFRPHDQIRAGDFPMLKPVGESGEIKFGSFGESKETIAVVPYAVQFAISRRMLVDDNIGAIDQVLGSYGDAVGRFEEATFYAMKQAGSGTGPVLKEDNKSVFHAAHGNLGAGAGISSASLSLGRAAMRKQVNQSKALLNIRPTIILVGPDMETEADMAVAVITPTAAGDVNPFAAKLRPVVGPIAGKAWELYADPAMSPVFVWGMLDGYSAPRMRIENPFGVQGVGISLEHDFGCGAIDFRGGYSNPGVA